MVCEWVSCKSWYGMRVTTGANIYYNTGNVGIGTATTPQRPLHVQTGIRIAGAGAVLELDGSDTCIYKDNTFSHMVFQTNTTERMRITSTGNVMIGGNVNVGSSTNPILHVYGSDPNNIIACFKHPNNSQGIGIAWDGLKALGNGSGSTGTGNQSIVLTPMGTGVVNVQGNLTATGNIGIGTATLTSGVSLDVNGSLLIRAFDNSAGGTKGIFFRDGFTNSPLLYNSSILTFDHSGDNFCEGLSINGGDGVSFCTGSATRQERMRITSTGNVGIGTTDIFQRLHVDGSISMGYWSTHAGSRFIGHFNTNKGENYLTGMEIESTTLGGNYSQKLHLRSHYFGTSEGRRLSIQENGNVVIGGNVNVGSLTNPSDSRIKKDIEDINDGTALNKLLLIQPTTYNYIDEERNKGFGKVYGFIAQQIREVIPEAVPIIEYIIPNIYKKCLINNNREVYHSIPLDTPIDTEVKIRGSEYKIKEVYEDYFVIDKDIDVDEAFVFGYSVDDFHTLNKDYIFTLNVCATQELHRRIEAQSVLLKSQDDRIKELETKVAMLMSSM